MINTDLHIHTNYSDGIHSVKEIIKLAKEKNLKNIAITDHDSINALNDIPNNLKNINVINGVEIQTRGTEILAYFFDKEDGPLNSILYKNKCAKREHTIKTLEKIQDYNIDIDIEEVEALSKDILMTPHIARVMLKKGYCKNIQEAYDKYFKKIKVKTSYGLQDTKKIIKTIIDAHGVVVLPHPWFIKKEYSSLYKYIEKLKGYGLVGIETNGYIPEDIDKDHKMFNNICKDLDLIPCGGSDFHGLKYFPHNILGKYNINENIINKLKNKIL